MGDQPGFFESMVNRFRGARDNGRGNALVRNVRAFFHATDPYGMPMDDRGTLDWTESLSRAPGLMTGASPFIPGGSPYDTYEGRPTSARDLTGAAGRVSDAAAQRVGSVVGRGFIGRSGRGALVAGPGQARYVEPRNALGYTLGQAPGVPGAGNWSVATAGRGTGAIPISREGGPIMTAPTQAEIDAMAAEQGGFPISPSANRPTPMRDGRGGYNGRSWASARGVGQGMRRTNEQALQEVMEQMERWRNRGGLLQER